MRYAWGLLLTLFLLPTFAVADTCPSLSPGSTGTSVTAVQKILYAAYANFPTPNGKFDATTQAALKQWQKEHGISQTGTVGPVTAGAMKLCTATTVVTPAKSTSPVTSAPISSTRTLSRGMSGSDVIALQQFLIAQNLLTADSATGYFGALTEAAVQSFQRSKGIVSSGTPATTGYGSVGQKTRAVIAVGSSTATNSTGTVVNKTVSAGASGGGGGGNIVQTTNSVSSSGSGGSGGGGGGGSGTSNSTNSITIINSSTSTVNTSGTATSTESTQTEGTTAVATVAPILNADGSCYVSNQSGGPAVSQVISPVRYQVFQRDRNLRSKISISATFSTAAECVEARIVDDANPTSVIVPWKSIASGTLAAGSTISGSIIVASGNWYQVQVRAVQGGKASSPMGAINNVGAGEVFIAAGQSNAAFWGQPPQRSTTGKVSYFDGTSWTVCADPIALGDGGAGGSPWCLFGDLFASQGGVPVGIVPVSFGGTAINAWLPGAGATSGVNLYDRLAARLKSFGIGGIRGVLWHQGESDAVAGTTAANYRIALQTIIDNSRVAAGYNVLWFIGHPYLGTIDASVGGDRIMQGQEGVINNVNVFEGAQTGDLDNSYRWDGLHFNALGLQQEAQKWFTAVAGPAQTYIPNWSVF